MNYDDVISQYNSQVKELSARYESVRFEDVHPCLFRFLSGNSLSIPSGANKVPKKGERNSLAESAEPTNSASSKTRLQTPRTALDIGAGSGRDSAWFAQQGYDVVAVEPSPLLMEEAKERHPQKNIHWLQDKMPDLHKTIRMGMSYDLILLSAVWMHIQPQDRPRVFRKLVSLLKPGGVIAISLRNGPHRIAESTYPVSALELEKLAVQHGLFVAAKETGEDRLGRQDVTWQTVLLQLPDDGTGALPLLRQIITKDRKSSTYKLALLRCLVRIADSAAGLARFTGDDTVAIPMGLVALFWIRMFKPLIEQDIPQATDRRGLGFVKAPFNQLRVVSPFELKVGGVFEGDTASALHRALKDAADTIRKMPATYITYPNSEEPVFKVDGRTASHSAGSATFTGITSEYLWSFGEMTIPLNIWHALVRYAHWIEPSLLFEWSELMQQYAQSRGIDIRLDQLMNALKWLDPERDTNMVRTIVQNNIADGIPAHCIWSGETIKKTFAVDHCFPFSAYPCNDLWNLLPTKAKVNLAKSDKLVTSDTLAEARDRMETWWQNAYFRSERLENRLYADRFRREALASLPLEVDERYPDAFFESLFEAILLKRVFLKQNQNLPDWRLHTL